MAGRRRWDEARILAWLARRGVPRGVVGSAMHDAAVLAPRGRLAVSCDQVVAGVHAAADVAPARLGRKAVDRAASDLAATAAEPFAFLVALRLGDDADDAGAKALLSGAIARARALGADVVGGDVSGGSGATSLAVTALGTLPARGRPPGRDRARVGDAVVLTGPTGGSGLGRHMLIVPRLAAGRALWLAGARALMDVSDGLALDLARLAAASGVRVVLDHVPIHPDARRAAARSGRTALAHALGDGEDHELIACMPMRDAQRALDRGIDGAPRAEIVGRVAKGRGVVLAQGGGIPVRVAPEGFVHGSAP